MRLGVHIKKNILQTCVIVQMTAIERMNGDSQNEVTKTRIELNIIPDYAGIQYGFVGTNARLCVLASGCIPTHTFNCARSHEKRLLSSSCLSVRTYHRGSQWTDFREIL
jgi:hypothetical protein